LRTPTTIGKKKKEKKFPALASSGTKNLRSITITTNALDFSTFAKKKQKQKQKKQTKKTPPKQMKRSYYLKNTII
jgi:lipoprotein-anchoring transpeptidase ErfK/SrfK